MATPQTIPRPADVTPETLVARIHALAPSVADVGHHLIRIAQDLDAWASKAMVRDADAESLHDIVFEVGTTCEHCSRRIPPWWDTYTDKHAGLRFCDDECWRAWNFVNTTLAPCEVAF